MPPIQQCPRGCHCEKCRAYGPIREGDETIDANLKAGLPGQPGRPQTGRGWLRISDDDVREVGIETVLSEGRGAFMIYYEYVLPIVGPAPPPTQAAIGAPVLSQATHQRSLQDAKLQPIALPQARAQFPPRPAEATPRSSEETIKPPTPTPPRVPAPNYPIPPPPQTDVQSSGSSHTRLHMPPALVTKTPTVVAPSNIQAMSNRALMNGIMARPTPPTSPTRMSPPPMNGIPPTVYPQPDPATPAYPSSFRAGSLPRVVRNVSVGQSRSRAGSPAGPSPGGPSTSSQRITSPERASPDQGMLANGMAPGFAAPVHVRPRAGSGAHAHASRGTVYQAQVKENRRPLPIPPPQAAYTTGASLSSSPPPHSQVSQRPRASSNAMSGQERVIQAPPRKQSLVSAASPPVVRAQ
jgi:ubiquitin carboxyl-terminal hydrolase 1